MGPRSPRTPISETVVVQNERFEILIAAPDAIDATGNRARSGGELESVMDVVLCFHLDRLPIGDRDSPRSSCRRCGRCLRLWRGILRITGRTFCAVFLG